MEAPARVESCFWKSLLVEASAPRQGRGLHGTGLGAAGRLCGDPAPLRACWRWPPACLAAASLLLRSILASLASSEWALMVSPPGSSCCWMLLSLGDPPTGSSCLWRLLLNEAPASGNLHSLKLLLCVEGGASTALGWGLWKTLEGSGTSGGLSAVASCLSCSCLLSLRLRSTLASSTSSDWALMVSHLEAPVAGRPRPWAFPLLEFLACGGSCTWSLLLLEVLAPGGS